MMSIVSVVAAGAAGAAAPLPIRVLECAHSPAPLLLSVPGNGGWNYMSTSLADRLGLREHFHVITYDMRGIGDTDEAPPSSWDVHIADAVALARAALARHRVTRLVLLGYSTGTYVALQAADRAPELFGGVIAIGLLPNSDERVQKMRKQKAWDAMWMPGWVVDAVSYMESDPLAVQLATATEISSNGGMLQLMTSPDVAPADQRTKQQLSAAMNAIEMPSIHLEQLRLRCPLYVIQGRRDTMGVAAAIPDAVASIAAPHKELQWIEGAGHILHVTHTEEVRAALARAATDLRARYVRENVSAFVR